MATKRRNAELTITERAAFIAWRLMSGDVWTTAEVASFMGVHQSTAYRRLCDMSLILPIYQDEEWNWQRADDRQVADMISGLYQLLILVMKYRR